MLDEMDACLAEASKVLRKSRATTEEEAAALTRCAAAVDRFAPDGSPYAVRARATKGMPGWVLAQVAGILRALRADYQAGYLRTVEELIHADVFADLLDMAGELQRKGFKDPAAVLAGSVLEEHLRKLAIANGIKTNAGSKTKKADTLNADLTKVGAYNRLVQKQVTAWLDLRNLAAHGRYDEYDHEQAAAMLRDVQRFVQSHPA